MSKRYIIIPGCSDLNRGDQALGWESKNIAEEAGFIGDYSIIAEDGEPVEQSLKEGYEILTPALGHPSRHFKKKENTHYTIWIKMKWGIMAIFDLISSLLVLNSFTRFIVKKVSKNKSVLLTIKRFEESDAVFMKGGGLIQSHGGLLSTYATYNRIYHILLAQTLRKPVYIMPNSFGPFEGPLVKTMVRHALKNCKLVTTRETYSMNAVKKELGIYVDCYPDLAFFLQNAYVDRQEVFRRFNLPLDRKLVGITMRPYRFPDAENSEEAYTRFKKEMAKFIVWLYKEGFMPVIVEHTLAITSHENDEDCIKDVIKNIDNKMFRYISEPNFNSRELKRLYGFFNYIIGTRFHSMIFSLSNKVPGIAISYDGYKSQGIMKDMGLEDYVIDIGDVSCEELSKRFISIRSNIEEITKKIDLYIEKANAERLVLIGQLKS